MPNLARKGDPVNCPADLHGWLSLPVVGVFTEGSSNVFCNNLPAVRLGDGGTHAQCPGPNNFKATSGAAKTLINDKPAVRDGDSTAHCGNPASRGQVMFGMTSPNTKVDQ